MTAHPFETQFASPYREDKETLETIFNQLKTIPYVIDFLNSLPVVIFILNAHRQIVFSNQCILEILNETDVKNFIGLRPGEAFKCIHSSENPAGCGTSESCQVCGKVLAILKSQKTSEKIEREAQITAIVEGKSVSFDLLVSATPFVFMEYPLTIVSLTDISHEKRRRALERIFFHDVLNTAGNIYNLADMLPQAKNADKDELADLIYIASRQLIEEIKTQKILLEAEIEEIEVQFERVHSKELVLRVAELFNKQEVVRNIEIHVEAADIDFDTDPVLLKRILANMMKNALEASDKGDIVSIGCERENDMIRFFVHNTAYIPPKIQLQLFQRSVSTKGRDRGLGLYSVKLLSEKYLSGKVSFTSTQKKGTTFTADFPLVMGSAGGSFAPSRSEQPLSKTGRENRMQRILVVDDEPQVRKMLRKLLEREGFEVTEAPDGREGVLKYYDNPFDLVLMDIVMPEKEGIESIRELKSNYPDVKIIAMSGGGKGAAEGYLDMAKILGAVHTFSKPVMPEHLLKTIRQILSDPGSEKTDSKPEGSIS